MYREMSKPTLDDETADRLLSCTLHPDDAPPGFAAVTALLRAAARPGSPSPIDQQRVAAMAAVIAGQAPAPEVKADKARKTKGRSLRRRARVSAVLAAGQPVQEFCKSATPGGKGSPGHHGHGKGHANHGKHNGQHGLPPQSNRRGHGRGE